MKQVEDTKPVLIILSQHNGRLNTRYVKRDDDGNLTYSIYSVDCLRGSSELQAARTEFPQFNFYLEG